MVHDELGAGIEVGPVELVRYVPAEGAEFSALLYQNRFLWPKFIIFVVIALNDSHRYNKNPYER